MTEAEKILEAAYREIEEYNAMRKNAPTDGKWLEGLTVRVATHIREWDIGECWSWKDWPDRKTRYRTATDTGIDAVGVRRSDGRLVAIQCKSRQLDGKGVGNPIAKTEINSFVGKSAHEIWAERWIVTNGAVPLGKNAIDTLPYEDDRPIRMVHIGASVQTGLKAIARSADGQSRDAMQDEAVETAVRVLRQHVETDSGGIPKGKARGRIILPCGTGKTRIALRIVERLTPKGGLAVILCPSIALVAQIRREFLEYGDMSGDMRTVSVCSDETAGYLNGAGKKREEGNGLADDPTLDTSHVSASEIKGFVTTDAGKIARWMGERAGSGTLGVVFGTYQSSHRIGEALLKAELEADVLVCDEAHRTAGLKKVARLEDRLRDFTVCHDDSRFPARYRVYQTATPRVYGTGQKNTGRKTDWLVRDMRDETIFGVELYRKTYTEAVRNGWLTDYRIIALGVNDPEALETANRLAREAGTSRQASTTVTFLRGLTMALVMGGGLRAEIPVKFSYLSISVG